MAEKPDADDSSPEIEGRYANFFKIGYNDVNFVIDFGQDYSGNPRIHTRIITSPAYIRAFIRLLEESLEGFDKANLKDRTGDE